MQNTSWTMEHYEPPQEPLKVIYADEDMLVLSKPSGLLTVPGKPEGHGDCLESRAQALYKSARIVHRLDMDTSGLVVMGMNPAAVRFFGAQFEQRLVGKTYIARVWGRLEQQAGVVDLPLRCDWPNRPKQMVDHELGRPAVTRWEVLGYERNVTRMALYPETGRSHQLRVHMLALGHPILGDDFYSSGEAFTMVKRLQLHAAKLEIAHPMDGQLRCFEDAAPF